MMTILLIIILISFLGVGVPDSALGTAWPAIYTEFHLPISVAGYITVTISICTVISSLLSATLVKKFGTGVVTAISTILTVIALFGCSVSNHIVFFFLFAISFDNSDMFICSIYFLQVFFIVSSNASSNLSYGIKCGSHILLLGSLEYLLQLTVQ